jgi:hypothetical protein
VLIDFIVVKDIAGYQNIRSYLDEAWFVHDADIPIDEF